MWAPAAAQPSGRRLLEARQAQGFGGLRVWGLGFGGLGCWGVRFGGLGFGVWGLRFGV